LVCVTEWISTSANDADISTRHSSAVVSGDSALAGIGAPAGTIAAMSSRTAPKITAIAGTASSGCQLDTTARPPGASTRRSSA
jgi:hypothetical protein